jgi:hypothetical protein
MRNHEDDVFCTTCGWEGTHHELIDDDEIDDETEDWVQCCPKCTSSFISMYVEQ